MKILGIIVLFIALGGCCRALHLTKPKTLTVDCLSQGNNDDFKHRLKWRETAEDQTVILLFKGEQLNINFELSKATIFDVLDVRYSNDGGWDKIGLSLDDMELGKFKTEADYAWGVNWNKFKSSGPIGGQRHLIAGKHSLALKIIDADKYGVELDYLRFNVHGATIHMEKNDFSCVHSPVHDGENHTRV